MANDFFENQFILDTPGASLIKQTLQQQGYGMMPMIRVKGIRWISPAAVAGHACVITASNGKVYWEAVAAGPNSNLADLIERLWMQDFALTTLASGRVYIYMADKWG